MRNKYFFSLLLCVFVLFTSSKCKKDKSDPVSQLPPATQTGANTFGCLVNGKAWVPKGWDGNKPNFFVIADPNYGGNLDIRAYNLNGDKEESISINAFGITQAGLYKVDSNRNIHLQYEKEIMGCYFLDDSQNYYQGFIKITKYDFTSGIISGEFEFSFFDKMTSCDSVKITNGRFDYKL